MKTTKIDRAIKDARDWIIRSNIQTCDKASPMNGAFNAWIDLDNGKARNAYPEITGYGMTALLYLDRLQGDLSLRERARRAGDWVIRRAMHSSGGVRPRDQYEGEERSDLFAFERHLVVIFDSGMVLFGLTNLYEHTWHLPYLKAARKIGDFLVDAAQKDGGLFYACFDTLNKEWIDRPHKWSIQGGSYHAKLSLGLLHLTRLTNDEKYKKAAEKACEAALALQKPTGRFVSFRDNQATHMHPHLYSAEGMLAAGLALDRKDLVRSAAAAARWSLSEQLEDGGLPCAIGLDGRPGHRNANERSDTLAQALRMASLCRSLGEPQAEPARLEKLAHKLLTFQCVSKEGRGGFYYGTEANGARRNHLNFWCSAFALQALVMYRDMLLGRPSAGAMDLFI